MDLVSRVKNILIDPQNEWRAIASEPSTPPDLIKSYVMILAAIPALCGFVGTSIIGVMGFRTPLFSGLINAILGYGLSLVGVFVVAFVIDFLAEQFGGQKNFPSAMKVAAYAPTAAWVASAFTIVPVLAFLSVLGLYSFYLFYVGLPVLMRTPQDRALPYVLAVIVCAIIVWVLILFVPAILLGMRLL